MDKLRSEHSMSQISHDNRRQALDMRLLEIEDLRRALAERDEALHAMETAQARLSADKEKEEENERMITNLEADLARVRRNAEALGRDLRTERTKREEEAKRREDERRAEKGKVGVAKKEVEQAKREVEKADRARKQAGAELRLLKERLGVLEGEKKGWQSHTCVAYVCVFFVGTSNSRLCFRDESSLTAIRAQHKLESKGLVVQIHYLKAKFTRENALRTDLVYQKRYLLVLLGRYERK